MKSFSGSWLGRWLLPVGGLFLLAVVLAPFIHYLIKGTFPPGFPIQTEARHAATVPAGAAHDSLPVDGIVATNINPNDLKQINGFMPFFYEKDSPPELSKLRQWGANAIKIEIEDFNLPDDPLVRILAPDAAAFRLPDNSRPPAPEFMPGPPSRLDLEAEVKALVVEAHRLGLVVQLNIPNLSEKWLNLAARWQVAMVNVGDESDIGGPIGQTIATVNAGIQLRLRETRKRYSGQVGIGFTGLVERMDPSGQQESPYASQYNLHGYDFLTINPHPDPSMGPNKLATYIAATARIARQLAAANGIRKVYLGALMVNTSGAKLPGFTETTGYAFTADEEVALYRALFQMNENVLDGYFLQFSGWETGSAVDAIRTYYSGTNGG